MWQLLVKNFESSTLQRKDGTRVMQPRGGIDILVGNNAKKILKL